MKIAAGAIVLAVSLWMMGCAEAESSQIARARLIANENRKLLQQIEQKDRRIAELEAELAKVTEDSARQIEQLNAASSEIIGTMILQQQQLQAELDRLKGLTTD